MATIQQTTTSSNSRVDPAEIDRIEALVEKYDFQGANGGLTVGVRDNDDGEPVITIYGGTGFDVTKPIREEDGSIVDREYGHTEDFLKEVAPALEEKLVVQYVGHEKCRFPVVAGQWTVWPDGTTRRDSFETSPDKPTDQEEQFAVLNTERDILLKLGSFGPSLTSHPEKAIKKARGESHLEAVKVETIPIPDAESSPEPPL